MALRGDLASVDLAQVFQMLALNKKVGLLSIHSSKLWKVLYFDQRGVTVHHNVHSVLDRIVAAFVRSGQLGEETVDEVRDHAMRMGQPLAESLLAGGYVDDGELQEQYRFELEEEIYDLFFVREAKFEFHENVTEIEGRDGSIDERFFYNCDSIIMEAARRIDEWAFISERIPSTAEVLVATVDGIDEQEFGADGLAIFDLLDGRRNVARVIEITGLTNFLVCKTISQLLDAGAVAPVAPEELVELGNECMADDHVADAISLYERAVELGLGLPESHALAAEAYQVAQEYELASYHLESEAEFRIGEGDLKGAANVLHSVAELLPTNLRARERLVELTLGADGVKVDGFDALKEGKQLVDLLTEFGDIERVRVLLERLLMVEPNDPDLKKALVNVHVRAGDQKRVVQLYESIADDLVRAHKPLEAISYLQKILLVDRSRNDISERVRRLYEFDERARRRGRALSALAVVFCLLAVLGAGYWFYSERAKEDFARIDVAELIEAGDFAGARAVYAGFIAEHPLTTAVALAEAELQKIDAEIEKFEARRQSELAAVEAERKKLRKRYRAAWDQHREQFLGGSPEAACESVRSVRDLIAEIGAAEDQQWATENQVESTLANLEKFLAESRELGRIYDEKMAAGDWAGARAAALRLHEGFEFTTDGRRVFVPVMVATRPAGATLLLDGKPLQRKVDGVAEPVTTPGLVLCRAGQPVSLTAQLDGFVTRQIDVDGRKSGGVEVVLEVQPAGRVDFGAPGQTGVAVDDGWLATGLRGGKIAIARVDGSERQVVELDGLKEIYGDPVVANQRVFFLSNESTLEAIPCRNDVDCRGWPLRLERDAVTAIGVGSGRLSLVDREFVLHCWEQGSARRIWGAALGDAPAGRPTIVGRMLAIGVRDGRVLLFDVADGDSVGVLRSPAGITSDVLLDGDVIYFASDDNHVRAVDYREGRVLWARDVGRAPKSGELALNSGTVVVSGAARVEVFDRATGEPRGAHEFGGSVQQVATQGDTIYARVARKRGRGPSEYTVLVACRGADAEVLWEFQTGEVGPGSIGLDGGVVALPTASGEVVLFH